MVFRTLLSALLIATLALVGCSKKDGDKAEESGGEAAAASGGGAELDPGQEYLFEGLGEDLAKAKKAKPEELDSFTCVSVIHAMEELAKVDHAGVKKLIAEGKQVCGHDVPLTMLKRQAGKIEAIRKDKPEEKFMSECVELKMALDELKKHGHKDLPEVTKNLELHKAACE